jgi:hypothetical protein
VFSVSRLDGYNVVVVVVVVLVLYETSNWSCAWWSSRLLNVEKERKKGCRPYSRALDMAFVPFGRKMVRTATSSEPAAQAESLPLMMSLVDASSTQHEDGEPEQMMRDFSMRDQVEMEDFNPNNVQVLEYNIALRRTFDDVRLILLAAFP